MEATATVTVTLKEIIEAAGMEMCYVQPLGGVVYIVRGELFNSYRQVHKIGCTKNLAARIPQLQAKYGRLWLHHAIWTDDPLFVESCLHRLFRDQWARTPKGVEWYKLTTDDLDWLQTFEAISAAEIKRLLNDPQAFAEDLAKYGPNNSRAWRRVLETIEM